MDKFYKIHEELNRWDSKTLESELKTAITKSGLDFEHWKGITELKNLDGSWADQTLHFDQRAQSPARIINGDVNITTNLTEYTTDRARLFAGSGRRGSVVNGKLTSIPRIPDRELSELNPVFKGTLFEDLHNFMQDYFQHPIRIRCQNRTVNGTSQSLYWHKDYPVENRYHIPIWTNPGHVLLFSNKDFAWKERFDPVEAMQPMDFVGHYIPPDGRVYELFTKDYMHAVGSVGIGWTQPRTEQTRCHLSFWLAKD